jgi:CheY-like chemotaxis protein
MEDRSDGILRIGVETVMADPSIPYLLGSIPEGPAVRLIVEDNGCGMRPEVLRRLFEPFFTTKPPGKGTGLGLAVVHGIVAAHGGAVRIVSSPGDGTRIEIEFPICPDAVPVEEPADSTETPAGGRERILLVDDEEGVLNFSQTALERLGYHVEGFLDPVLALERLSSNPTVFDLVLTDLTMPRLNGAELAAEVRRIAPGLPVVLASGYAARGELADGAERHFAAMLGKPYGIGELGLTVRSVLGQPVPA